MKIEFFTTFNKNDTVFNKIYGKGVVTAISVRAVLLPDGEKDEEINYFVKFADEEKIVGEKELSTPHRSTDTPQLNR